MMVFRGLFILLLVSGLGLVALAALDYFQVVFIASYLPGQKKSYLVVGDTESSIADARPGTETTAVVSLQNKSSQMVGIVGLAEC